MPKPLEKGISDICRKYSKCERKFSIFKIIISSQGVFPNLAKQCAFHSSLLISASRRQSKNIRERWLAYINQRGQVLAIYTLSYLHVNSIYAHLTKKIMLIQKGLVFSSPNNLSRARNCVGSNHTDNTDYKVQKAKIICHRNTQSLLSI